MQKMRVIITREKGGADIADGVRLLLSVCRFL